MPTVLLEHQLEMLDLAESRSLLFGTEDTGYLTLTPPKWTGGDGRDGDTDRAQEDGRYFGRDLRGGATLGFEIGVLTDQLSIGTSEPYRSNVDYIAALNDWWDDEDFRSKPWQLAVLRYCVAGRTWRVYGRPRRFDDAPTILQQRGYTPVVCDFGVIDSSVYADVPDSLTIPLVALPDGGLIAPLEAPLTTTLSTVGDGAVTIGGSKSTWPWVTFNGPSTNPKVTIVGGGPLDNTGQPRDLVVGLNTEILDGMSVTVDPRPWSRGVYRNDGASYAGYLSPDTPVLRELKVRPNKTGESYQVIYSGTDATGTSSAIVNWRTARSKP